MKWLLIGLTVGIYLFETVVAQLNYKHSLKPVPRLVQDVYDIKRYRKWLAYSLDVHRFSLVQGGFALVLSVVLLLGPFSFLAKWTSTWLAHPILQSLAFLGVFQTLSVLLMLPLQAYRTFSIEERHGFNRTTTGVFLKDLVISYLVTLVLGGLILGGIQALYLHFVDRLWIFIFVTWAVLSGVMVLAVAFLGKLFLRLFNTFTPLPEGELKTRIEALAKSLGFSIKAILVMDASKRSTKSNAAFTGIGKTKEVILFDTLLEKMSEDEIMAVLAHELGHAMHKDTWRLLGQQIGVMALYAAGIGLILQSPGLFTAFGLSGVHFGFSVILFSILFEPISLLLSVPLSLFSRQAEYKADAFAAKHTRAAWLVSALKVLARENLVNLNPHPFFVLLYYSHPTMHERIQALQAQ